MKVVRVKKITKIGSGEISKIFLTNKREYLLRSSYIIYGEDYFLHPYKWWQLWRIIEIPAYYLWELSFKNSRLKDFNATHIATKIAIVLIESSIGFLFIKFCLGKIF